MAGALAAGGTVFTPPVGRPSVAVTQQQAAPVQESPPEPASATLTRVQQLQAALTDPQASPDARRTAAAALLDEAEPDDVATMLRAASPDAAQAVAAALLERQDAAPGSLLAVLGSRLATRATRQEAAATLRLFIAQPRKEAVGACVAALDRAHGWRREATLQALAAMTGREDLGNDPARWRDWWETARWLPEVQWSQQLLRWRAGRLVRMQREQAALQQRLSSLLRELHARLDDDEKPARLEAMLRDPLALVRLAGLDLVERDLLNARGTPQGVADALTALLSDANETVRLRASALLLRLGEGVEEARVALAKEESPAVAANLLRALAQQPRSTDVAGAVRWLASEDAHSRAAAAELLVRLAGDAALQQPRTRTRVVSILRQRVEEGTLLSAEASLLATVGEAVDRERVVRYALRRAEGGDAAWTRTLIAMAAWPDAAEGLLASGSGPADALAAAARALGGVQGVVALLRVAAARRDAEQRRVLITQAASLALDEGAVERAFVQTVAADRPAARAFAEGVLNAAAEQLKRDVAEEDAARRGVRLCEVERFVEKLLEEGFEKPAQQGALLLTRLASPAASQGAEEPQTADAEQRGETACDAAASLIVAIAALWAVDDEAKALEAIQSPQQGVQAVELLQQRPWGAQRASSLARRILQRFNDTLSPQDRAALERAASGEGDWDGNGDGS